eukprot:gene47823-50600_t
MGFELGDPGGRQVTAHLAADGRQGTAELHAAKSFHSLSR